MKEKRAVVPAMMLYFVVLVRGMAGARNTDKPRRIGCGINRFSGLK